MLCKKYTEDTEKSGILLYSHLQSYSVCVINIVFGFKGINYFKKTMFRNLIQNSTSGYATESLQVQANLMDFFDIVGPIRKLKPNSNSKRTSLM